MILNRTIIPVISRNILYGSGLILSNVQSTGKIVSYYTWSYYRVPYGQAKSFMKRALVLQCCYDYTQWVVMV